MRTALFDGHCQSQRPRRACGAGPSLAGWEGRFGMPRIFPRPATASEATPPRRAWVGRGAGGKPKKNRPIQNPSLPSLVGTAPRPVRTGCAAIRSREAISVRKVVKPCSPPDGTRAAISARTVTKPAHRRMDAANRSARGAPAALAHPLRDGKENSEQRGFWLSPAVASPQSRRPPPATSGALPPRRALVGRGTGGKSRKHRPIQNPSLPSLVGTAPVRPGRAARQFAPARPSAPARSSSPAHRRTALAPPSAPAPSPSPAHRRMDAANRSAQGAPAPLAHPLRDGKKNSEQRGFLPRRHAAGIISPHP